MAGRETGGEDPAAAARARFHGGEQPLRHHHGERQVKDHPRRRRTLVWRPERRQVSERSSRTLRRSDDRFCPGLRGGLRR